MSDIQARIAGVQTRLDKFRDQVKANAAAALATGDVVQLRDEVARLKRSLRQVDAGLHENAVVRDDDPDITPEFKQLRDSNCREFAMMRFLILSAIEDLSRV